MNRLIKYSLFLSTICSHNYLFANDSIGMDVHPDPGGDITSEPREHLANDPINGILRNYLPESVFKNRIGFKQPQEQNSWVTVNISVEGSADTIASKLRDLGMKSVTVSDYLVSGRIRTTELPRLRAVKGVLDVRQSVIYTRAGAATTQGDVTLEADIARRNFALTGKGVRVGVMSDSFSCLGDGKAAQQDIDSGELPLLTTIAKDAAECTEMLDEGRALAQVIHDIAPEAEIVFHTAFGLGTTGLAEAIRHLAEDYKVDVIVDDFATFDMPFFQDSAVSQAIDDVTKQGVTYVTAAGNSGTESYASLFRPTIGPGSDSISIKKMHDFDASEDSINIYQKFTLPQGEVLLLVLQWDDAYYSVSGLPGAESDLNIHVLDKNKTELKAVANAANIGRDPYEVLHFFNPEDSGETEFNLMISLESGKNPNFVKYMLPLKFEGKIENTFDELYNNGSTVIGHANSEGSISVGATAYRASPAYGLHNPTVEPFSARGGTPLLFNIHGERYVDGAKFRVKPDITGPNNVNTTFFKGKDIENDGFPNFRGTSASAPHIAGVVALMLERDPTLEPWKIRRILQTTATDIIDVDIDSSDEGYDLKSGFGLVNALKAIEKIGDIAELREPQSELPSGADYRFNNKPETEVIPSSSSSSNSGSLSLLTVFSLMLALLIVSIRRVRMFFNNS